MNIKCNALKCAWNYKEKCTKEQIAIREYLIHQFDEIKENHPACISFSSRESLGHLDFSKGPKR
mgnify:FL=1